MEDIPFDIPVSILLGDESVAVVSAGAAARYLLEEWPAKKGVRHRRARQALVDLLEGTGSAVAAREAFEAAADEAEIRVGGWHAGNPIAKFLLKQSRLVKGSDIPRPRPGARNNTRKSRS